MAEGRFGIFKVLATCTHCGNPVVVNGPLTEPACPSCSRSITLSPDVWGDIIGEYLEDYAGLEPGDGKNCTLMTGEVTVKYDYVRLPPPDPACPSCEENWDLDSVGNGEDRMLVCLKCGRKTPTFPAPSWLQELVPTARQVFFAERDSEPSRNDSEKDKPVALSCPKCGGGLVVTADCERTTPCRYCGVDVYLPDGVWQKLHPAKVAKYWMVRFQDD